MTWINVSMLKKYQEVEAYLIIVTDPCKYISIVLQILSI